MYEKERLEEILEILESNHPFKDSTGRFLTQSLCKETSYSLKDKSTVFFTLKENDDIIKVDDEDRTVFSLRKLFLAIEDPTEYHFAIKVFGSWEQWKKIRELEWCNDFYLSWREELDKILEAKGFEAMVGAAKGGSPQASKWLAERGWRKEERPTPGRPKQSKKTSEQYSSTDSKEISSDLERLKQLN